MKKKLLFDATLLDQKLYTGRNFYTLNTLKALSFHSSFEIYSVGSSRCNDLISDEKLNVIPIDFPVSDSNFMKQLLKMYAIAYKVDAIFSPYYALPEISNCALISTVHDLLPLSHPQWFTERTCNYFANDILKSIKVSDAVVAISQATKEEITKHVKVPEEKIHVVYPGLNHSLINAKINSNSPQKEPYLLSVLSSEPRKNLSFLLESFAKLKGNSKKFKDLKIVLVGNFENDKKTLLKDFEVSSDDVIFAGYLDDQELANYYRHAKLFLHTSLGEGFGSPVLEAMSFGTPVISAELDSIKEIASDKVVYFSFAKNDLLKKIEDVFDDYKAVKENAVQAQKLTKNFSWENSAKEISKMIKSCTSF